MDIVLRKMNRSLFASTTSRVIEFPSLKKLDFSKVSEWEVCPICCKCILECTECNYERPKFSIYCEDCFKICLECVCDFYNSPPVDCWGCTHDRLQCDSDCDACKEDLDYIDALSSDDDDLYEGNMFYKPLKRIKLQKVSNLNINKDSKLETYSKISHEDSNTPTKYRKQKKSKSRSLSEQKSMPRPNRACKNKVRYSFSGKSKGDKIKISK